MPDPLRQIGGINVAAHAVARKIPTVLLLGAFAFLILSMIPGNPLSVVPATAQWDIFNKKGTKEADRLDNLVKGIPSPLDKAHDDWLAEQQAIGGPLNNLKVKAHAGTKKDEDAYNAA